MCERILCNFPVRQSDAYCSVQTDYVVVATFWKFLWTVKWVAHGWQESRPNRSNIPDHGRASASAAQAALGGVGESSEPSRGLAEEMEMTNNDPLEDALERAPWWLIVPSCSSATPRSTARVPCASGVNVTVGV